MAASHAVTLSSDLFYKYQFVNINVENSDKKWTF